MLRMMSLLLLLLLTAITSPAMGKDKKSKDEFWYRNDYECGGYKIALHTLCRHVESDDRLKTCAQQQVEITRPDGAKKKLYAQSLENEKIDYHSIGAITCVSGNSGKSYIYALLGNGGNCDTCEISGVLDLDTGRWANYGKIWLAGKRERRDIINKSEEWWKTYNTSAYFIMSDMRIEEDYRE